MCRARPHKPSCVEQATTPGEDARVENTLPSDLSIAKMHKLFLEQSDQEVNYAFYYNIFIYDFNLGFGHPAKDICSECVKFKSQIKNPGLSDQDKEVESARFVLHRRRARKYYDLMNDVDETYNITFT